MAGKRIIHDAYWRRHLERTAAQFGERSSQVYAYGSPMYRAYKHGLMEERNQAQRNTPVLIDDDHDE